MAYEAVNGSVRTRDSYDRSLSSPVPASFSAALRVYSGCRTDQSEAKPNVGYLPRRPVRIHNRSSTAERRMGLAMGGVSLAAGVLVSERLGKTQVVVSRFYIARNKEPPDADEARQSDAAAEDASGAEPVARHRIHRPGRN